MANEFKHASVGSELSQAEWEGTQIHVFNGQAIGDILYASSASQLSRLPIGNGVLYGTGGSPAWATEISNITLNTAVAKGTWTASGTWTIPAVTLGGDISGGANKYKTTSFYLAETATPGIDGLKIARSSDNVLKGLELANLFFTNTGSFYPNATTNGNSYRFRCYDGDLNDVIAISVTNGTGAGLKAKLVLGAANVSIHDSGGLPNADPHVAGQLYYTAADGIVRRSSG